MENEPTVPFSFIKVDEKTGNELAGAEFTLYQGDGERCRQMEHCRRSGCISEEGIVDFQSVETRGNIFLKRQKLRKDI